MADMDKLFGSDSESEKEGKNSGGESPAGSSKSSSSSGSGSKSGSNSDSGSDNESAPGSPAAGGAGSNPASPSGSSSSSSSGSDSAPGSPSGSKSPGSPAKSGSGSKPQSPAAKSDSGSAFGADDTVRSKSKSRSKSPQLDRESNRSKTPENRDAGGGSDSDIPTGRRNRIASDSGSDPDAVRATAEDIFGEADDISDDEKNQGEQEEEKEEELPETRIEVEIPRVVADLGESLFFAKLPNFLSVETRPFDPSTYEDEIDEDEVMDEEGRARLKLKVENTVRWRYVNDPNTGEAKVDEFGDKIRESNAKVIKWSDGSMSLHLGTEIFDIFSMPMQDHNHLYIRQGTGLQGQAMFRNKLSFRPHSTDSFTHRKMTMSLADRSNKSQKIKVLPIAGIDPEMSKTENIKKEEEKLRASIRRENQQRRTRERAHARSGLSASYLEGDEDGGVSIAAIKNRYKKNRDVQRDYSSDSADEDYETDGEEDLKRNRLQKAKRLADSDDEGSDKGSDAGSPVKKSRVMSDSGSD